MNLTGARQIAAEAAGSVALLADGSVKTWGTGCEGQLGTGQLNCQGQPVPVTALIGNVVRIAGGDLHTLAVRGDGTVWAWGFNLDRQVANDIEIRQPTPRPVVGLPGGMTQVAGAKESSVALDGSGRAWVWGRVSGNPTQVRPTPVLVPGLAGAFTISAGNVHYHALIRRPAFAIALSSTEGTIIAGGSVTTQVSLTPINGYTGSATLTVASLPAGMTATFSSPQVGPASPVTLTLATERSPAGNYQVAVTATDATANPPSQTVIYDLTITGPAERDNP